MKTVVLRLTFALAFAVTALAAFAAEPAKSPITVTDHPLEFIDTSFENASPVWYEFAPDRRGVLEARIDELQRMIGD